MSTKTVTYNPNAFEPAAMFVGKERVEVQKQVIYDPIDDNTYYRFVIVHAPQWRKTFVAGESSIVSGLKPDGSWTTARTLPDWHSYRVIEDTSAHSAAPVYQERQSIGNEVLKRIKYSLPAEPQRRGE